MWSITRENPDGNKDDAPDRESARAPSRQVIASVGWEADERPMGRDSIGIGVGAGIGLPEAVAPAAVTQRCGARDEANREQGTGIDPDSDTDPDPEQGLKRPEPTGWSSRPRSLGG